VIGSSTARREVGLTLEELIFSWGWRELVMGALQIAERMITHFVTLL
jgi:hypothetical protein